MPSRIPTGHRLNPKELPMKTDRITRFAITLEAARLTGDLRTARRCRRALRALGA